MSDTMGTKDAANAWGIPQKTISRLCREGRIPGASQDAEGSPWHIPKDAPRPKYTARKRNHDAK